MAFTLITNRFTKACNRCNKYVKTGEGFAYRSSPDAYWATYCKDCCPVPIPAPQTAQVAAPVVRRLTAQGEVFTPYEPQNLPLLRAFPGARWNPDSKCWRVSLQMQDRERVLELADKLQLEVPAELRVTVVTEQAQLAEVSGLYPFQVKGVNFLAVGNKRLLGSDMGTGKTIQALAALPINGKAIVVCPSVVKYNWQAECRRWRPDLTPVVLSGKGSFRTPKTGEVVILNPDILPEYLGRKVKGKAAPQADTIPSEISQGCAGVVFIADEAHMCRDFKSLRSARIKTLGSLCWKVWFLTGTPLLNHPQQLYSVLDAGGMAKDVFGSWSKFVTLFHGQQDRWGGYSWGLPDAEVPERLRRVMLRHTKAEVLPDLPPKTFTDLVVNGISASLRAKLDEMWEEWADCLLTTNELPPFDSFSAVRALLAENRIEAAVEFAEQCEEQGTPLVVFSAHRKPVETLGAREGWATIYGGTPPEERTELVRKFQAGELKGLALTIAAGGVGITLTRASTMLFVDLDWTPALNAQAADRCVRIGQEASAVNIYRMVSDHPLDRHVNQLIAKKIAMIEHAVEKTATATVPPPVEPAPTPVQEPGETPEQYTARMARIAAEDAERQAVIERQQQERAESRVNALAQRYQDKIGAWIAQPITPELDAAIRMAFALMCQNDPDYATQRNGIGFNQPDAYIARDLGHNLQTETETRALFGLLYKYRNQLEGQFPILFPAR